MLALDLADKVCLHILQVALVQIFLPFIVSYISSKSAHTGDLRLPTLKLPATDGAELLEMEPSGFPVIVVWQNRPK